METTRHHGTTHSSTTGEQKPPLMDRLKSKVGRAKSKRDRHVRTEPKYVVPSPTSSRLFSHHHAQTLPLFTTQSKDGRTITVSQDPTLKRENPMFELVGAARTTGINNSHIDGIFQHGQRTIHNDTSNLSAHGKVLARDTENIIGSVDRMFLEKNKNGALQQVVGRSALSAKNNANILKGRANRKAKEKGINSTTGAQYAKEEAKEKAAVKAKESKDYLRRLILTLVRSGDLREITTEALELFKELAGNQNDSLPLGSGAPFGSTHGSSVPISSSIPVGTTQTTVLPSGQVVYVSQNPTILTGPSAIQRTHSRKFDEQTKMRTTDTFINILTRLGMRPEYKRAVKDLFRLYDKSYVKGKELKETRAGLETDNAKMANQQTVALIQSFVGEGEWNKFSQDLRELTREVRNDDRLSSFITRFRHFILWGIDNPQQLQTPEKRQEAMNIITELESFLRDRKWNSRFNLLLSDSKGLLNGLKNDQYARDLSQQLSAFAKDFVLNEQGRPDLFVLSDSIHQFKLILLPLIRAHLSNVPIDRIDMQSPSMDLILEDLKFSFGDVLPGNFLFDIRNKMQMATHSSDANGRTIHELKLRISEVKPIVKDLKFYVHKKTGLKWTDYGHLDLEFRNRGMTIEIEWEFINESGRTPYLTTKNVVVQLDKIYAKVYNSKHSVIDKIGLALGKTTLRKMIVRRLTAILWDNLRNIDSKVNNLLASRPSQPLLTSADRLLERAYYSGRQRALAAQQRRMQGKRGRAHGRNLGAKVRRGAQKVAKGMDNVAPTNLTHGQQQYGQPSYLGQTSYLGQPSVVYGQPTVVYGQPSTVYGQPTTVYSQSAYLGQPSTVYSQPNVIYTQPTVLAQPGSGQHRVGTPYTQPIHPRELPQQVIGTSYTTQPDGSVEIDKVTARDLHLGSTHSQV